MKFCRTKEGKFQFSKFTKLFKSRSIIKSTFISTDNEKEKYNEALEYWNNFCKQLNFEDTTPIGTMFSDLSHVWPDFETFNEEQKAEELKDRREKRQAKGDDKGKAVGKAVKKFFKLNN